ncbi:MAG: hypothetical protein ABS36_02900 [Acidobacteria bacterium SCN 69-37]|nr:MAG: hypothetical protein ABS36_02900 [Acidobacteria bacterium SCN 69-37]
MPRITLTAACLAMALAAAPGFALAQASAPAAAAPAGITAADAAPFLGDWSIVGESPMGPFTTALSIKVENGQVGAVLSSDIQPATPIANANIRKTGNNLVLYYSFDYEGNSIPAVLTLTPDADKVNAGFSFADGAFEMGGVGTKTPAAPAAN